MSGTFPRTVGQNGGRRVAPGTERSRGFVSQTEGSIAVEGPRGSTRCDCGVGTAWEEPLWQCRHHRSRARRGRRAWPMSWTSSSIRALLWEVSNTYMSRCIISA